VGFQEGLFGSYIRLCRSIAPHRPRFYIYPYPRNARPTEIAAQLELKAREALHEYYVEHSEEQRTGAD
jgi:hypothetical protein